MKKAKYKMYWCSYNWYTAANEKNYRQDGRKNYKRLEQERAQTFRRVRAWMLRNPLELT